MAHTSVTRKSHRDAAFRVEYQPSALEGLDSTEQTILDGAIELVAGDVEARCIPVERVSIKRHFSPEDESEELVLTIWTQTTPDAALDYWLTLADVMAKWTSGLSQPYRDIADERIAIAVRSTART